jgi:hypothetical protein
MSLAKRDKAINTMKTELEKKKLLLKNKYKELHNAAADNELLKGVLEDYLNYYDTIKDEKKKQYEALTKTLQHIDSIEINDDRMLYNIKQDQKEITKQINLLKKS